MYRYRKSLQSVIEPEKQIADIFCKSKIIYLKIKFWSSVYNVKLSWKKKRKEKKKAKCLYLFA